MNNFVARLQRDWRWQAFLRGIRRGVGLPVEPIDYSPEAQLVRLAERLRRLAEDGTGTDDAGHARRTTEGDQHR